MNHHKKTSDRSLRRDGRWTAIQRLEDAIERNIGENSHAARTELLGRQIFGEDWDEPKEANTTQ